MENISLLGQLLIFSSILIIPIMLFIFLGKSSEDRFKDHLKKISTNFQ
jgi:hypothetical protein